MEVAEGLAEDLAETLLLLGLSAVEVAVLELEGFPNDAIKKPPWLSDRHLFSLMICPTAKDWQLVLHKLIMNE